MAPCRHTSRTGADTTMRTASEPTGEARFRRLALSLPDAEESSHMGAADFRLHNRIFATLAYVARGQGTLKLTPEQQRDLLAELPGLAEPASGGWGRMGMTLLRLDAPDDVMRGALLMAYRNVAAKQAVRPKRAPTGKAAQQL